MNVNSVKLNDQTIAIEENRVPPTEKPVVRSGKLRHLLNAFEARTWRNIVIGIPYIWMLLLFFLPFLYVFKISLAESIMARPPFSTLFTWVGDAQVSINLVFDNYLLLLQDALYTTAYLNSLKIAFVATLICLIIGYIMAYGIARAQPTMRNILLLLVILPFWTSFLLRVYAWMGLLANHGIINNLLLAIGLIDKPIQMMYTNFAMYVVFVYSFLPFMILPLYANLEKLDATLDEASADLGAKPVTTFLTITLPLSVPGIIAGCMLVFIPAVGEFVIPTLVGGPDSLMIGRMLFDEFFANRDWPVASAVAVVLLILLVFPFMLYKHFSAKQEERSP
ncbi:MAG: putrescine ABC transporter permease PotH [Deltaproteobacteria bacterium]|nr:MAG: putrescine ABC transporter permease PotH [Deltaproteobacteria bacterium]